MSDALIRLPSPDAAPAIRDAIRATARWSLDEVTDGWGSVAPGEGAGAVYPYFRVKRLCDARTKITERTWAPLVAHPKAVPDDTLPRTQVGGEPDPQWREKLHEEAARIHETGRRGGDLEAIATTIFALEPHEAPAFLERQAPRLFEDHPDGSLWFVETDPLLSRRLGLLRVLLGFELLPDYPDALAAEGTHPQIVTLQEHTLTRGYDFDQLIDPLLTIVPPAALGYVFPWSPHALVFLFGHPTGLVEPRPPTLASLYMPQIQRGDVGLHWNSEFFDGFGAGDAESLLQWWVGRLNVIYSHATDPTRFAHRTTAQMRPSDATAWLLTFERMLADHLANASSPQGPPIARLTVAFDQLDKAESLLGYRKATSGNGFKRLLRRKEMVARLDRVWDDRLPLQLQKRFKQHSHELYDRVYDGVQAAAYEFRLHGTGIQVWSPKTHRLEHRTWDNYVPTLIRGVRNSAHGLIEVFDSPDRGVIESHSGKLPAELPDLVSLLTFAMVADAEALCAGVWFNR